MKGRDRGLTLRALAGVLLTFLFSVVGARLLQFRGRFIMVTVEESSTSAVTGWPLLAERLPGVFLDCASSAVSTQTKPGLLGVSLGVYYSATSQGIELGESLAFSRTGRATVPLTRPLSLVTEGLAGEREDIVDNRARVLAGDLTIESTTGDGTVRFRYGGERFSLKPGEAWAEMLVLETGGVKKIDPLNWVDEFPASLESGFPVTRLAIANRGFWPKANVRTEVGP